jgi:hypothetical protein
MGEAGVEDLHNRTKPLLDDYQSALQDKMSSKSASKAYVYSFSELIDQMPSHLATWDVAIQNVFPAKSLEYNTIFSVNRSDIYKGTTRQILDNITNFKNKVEQYPALAAIVVPVKNYVLSLSGTRDIKSDKKETVELNSDIFDAKYDALGVMMYRNLGKLIDLYADDPSQIERYFPISMLRTHPKNANGSNSGSILNIAPGGTATADFMLQAGKTYLIDIKDSGSLQVYGGKLINQAPTSTPIELTAEDNELTAEELGYPGNTLMIFKNPNLTIAAQVEIFLLDED